MVLLRANSYECYAMLLPEIVVWNYIRSNRVCIWTQCHIHRRERETGQDENGTFLRGAGPSPMNAIEMLNSTHRLKCALFRYDFSENSVGFKNSTSTKTWFFSMLVSPLFWWWIWIRDKGGMILVMVWWIYRTDFEKIIQNQPRGWANTTSPSFQCTVFVFIRYFSWLPLLDMFTYFRFIQTFVNTILCKMECKNCSLNGEAVQSVHNEYCARC